MIVRVLRWLLAVVLGVLAGAFITHSAAAAVSFETVAPIGYTYDGSRDSALLASATTERGPPAHDCTADLPRDAVDHWSHGALARSGVTVRRVTTGHGDLPALAQIDMVTSTTAEAAQGCWRTSVPVQRSQVAADAGITYGAHDVGPLSEAVANTFRGGSYTERTLQSETTLYRVYGGKAGPVGSYWSRTAPSGALQAQLDGAINPAWWNTIERVATARVPAGTTIYEGAAGEQGLAGGGGLLGGGSQVYLPNVDPAWVTP